METKFNFNSQVCTDKNQSERLLALGLKNETADMRYAEYYIGDNCDGPYTQYQLDVCPPLLDQDIPAWSLHRLMEMAFNSLNDADADAEDEIYFIRQKNPFESMLELFEWLIKEGYFNKEYLV